MPLLLHAFVVMLSTALYHPSQLGKAVERGPFLLAYVLGGFLKVDKKSLYTFNLLLVFSGLLLMPVVFYKFYKTGQPAMFWGGWFEVGSFYTIFAVASLSLFFYSNRFLYLISFMLFAGIVFFTLRRSTMLGLGFSLLAFALIVGKSKSRKAFFGILLTLLFGFSVSTIILVDKDHRYRALYEVLAQQRSLDEETLNTVSSYRWEIAKKGIEVVSKDIERSNWFNMLVGHGINAGFYLEPRSPVGGIYESILPISEFIEKGLLGFLTVIWVYILYGRFLLSFRIYSKEDYLLMSFLLALGAHLVGAIFTFFWDAMLPLYLILFSLVERVRGERRVGGPFPQGQ
ncbi:MAG: hypothetical protein N3D14_00865 [Aquificaceae bacterium]|nr:hypothetical protein [Aquificaceae bacterium]